jgi:hypothetical protein
MAQSFGQPLARPPEVLGEHETSELYFAYGSNMHFKQMASRCGDSTLFGIGVLRGYKWQVNTRGGGNVVVGGPGDSVEGVVFAVSPSDVETLRRYEGVEQGVFEERRLEIQVERIRGGASSLGGRKTTDVAKILDGASELDDRRSGAFLCSIPAF